MTFVQFDLERWQSVWEHRVRFNLSESGVHPMSLDELLEITDTDPTALSAVRLGYSQSNGTDELRAAIAGLYPGATADNVLVTVGGSEANFIACWSLLGSGEHVAVQVPNYLQIWGIARSAGADVTTFPLRFDRRWDPDLDAMRSAIREDTKLVVVTTPNNPTGHVFSADARRAILDRVQQVGAWLLVDEVYQGAERTGDETESWWGQGQERYDRVIVTNGLSKAYGLPGLRIGWIVGPPGLIASAWQRHDYTVICPSALSDFLAIRVFAARHPILERTRRIIRDNYQVLEPWLRSLEDLFEWQAPDAGAICLVRYRLGMDSIQLVERLREAHDVLLVPGAHVGLTNYLRIGYGDEPGHLRDGLAALKAGMTELAGTEPHASAPVSEPTGVGAGD